MIQWEHIVRINLMKYCVVGVCQFGHCLPLTDWSSQGCPSIICKREYDWWSSDRLLSPEDSHRLGAGGQEVPAQKCTSLPGKHRLCFDL